MSHPRRLVPKNTPLIALALLAIAACKPGGDDAVADDGENPTEEGQTPTPGGPVATVTGISGPGGLTSPELAAGTFLGKGAVLEAGQTVETPRGTLAELELADGTKLRLNEDTAVKAPTDKWPRRLELTRGELVAVAAKAQTPLEIAAGPEMLRVTSGEVQARNVGDARRYAVIAGAASLKTPSKELDLGPGESIDAPLPEDRYEEAPQLSLAPLEDTAWTRTFVSAARMSEAVPRGVGSLTARRAGTNTERQALRLTEQAVTVNIAGRVAHTEIEQAFFNDKPAVLEGIYRFPLPSDGSVSGLELLVGQRWMRGEVLEKQRARNIFKQIVDATIPRDPALLEWEQGNLFKLRIFPIPGRGQRKVKLSYTQVLPVVGDKLRYRFPMGGSGAGGTPIENFTFTVNVDRSELDTDRLGEISTPMLALDRDLDGDVVKMSTEVRNFIPTSDLGVDIPLAESAQRVSAATHLDKDGHAYFMLALRPEFETGRDSGPTNLAFVMDRSHSTAPELWTLGKGIVEAMATTLGPDDRFTVLACDTACDRLPGGLQETSSGAVADIEEFLSSQDLAGASDVGGMMQAGADALASASGQRVVVYLGDGAPSSGAMAPDELARTLRGPMQGTRVLAVALGSRSDETTLGSVLDAAGGELVRADPRDNVRDLVRDLALRARVPMVNDLQLDLPDGMMMVRTQGTGGLRKEDTLLVAGQFSHDVTGDIRLTGRGPDGPVEATFPVNLTASRGAAPSSVHNHLARTWAQMQIAHLTKTKGFEAKEEIVKLSQDYTVLSRFTAMLVLENDAMFREFNVVRRAEDKDTWDGKLPTPEEPVTETTVTTKAAEEAEETERDGDRKATRRKTLEPLGEGGGEVVGGLIDDKSATEKAKDEKKRGNSGPQPFPGSTPAEDPPPPPAEPVPEPEPDFFTDNAGGSPGRAQDFPSLPDFDENRNKGDFGAADDDGGDAGFDLGDDEDEDGFLPSGASSTKTPSQPSKKAKKASKPKPSPKTSAPMDPWSSGVGGVSGGGSVWGGGGKRDRRWSPAPALAQGAHRVVAELAGAGPGRGSVARRRAGSDQALRPRQARAGGDPSRTPERDGVRSGVGRSRPRSRPCPALAGGHAQRGRRSGGVAGLRQCGRGAPLQQASARGSRHRPDRKGRPHPGLLASPRDRQHRPDEGRAPRRPGPLPQRRPSNGRRPPCPRRRPQPGRRQEQGARGHLRDPRVRARRRGSAPRRQAPPQRPAPGHRDLDRRGRPGHHRRRQARPSAERPPSAGQGPRPGGSQRRDAHDASGKGLGVRRGRASVRRTGDDPGVGHAQHQALQRAPEDRAVHVA